MLRGKGIEYTPATIRVCAGLDRFFRWQPLLRQDLMGNPMQTRLSRGEYWLLETVVHLWCPLAFLDAARYKTQDGIVEMFNKPGHGLNRKDLLETLAHLADDQLIEGVRGGEVLVLDAQQIDAALSEAGPTDNPSHVSYRLTQKGGAAWEAFAAPDWVDFVKEELDDDTRTGFLIGMTDWRVEKYLKYLDTFECDIDFPSVCWEDVGPWEATYWKLLPLGRRVSFRWHNRREPPVSAEFTSLAFSGFCEFRDRWYRWR